MAMSYLIKHELIHLAVAIFLSYSILKWKPFTRESPEKHRKNSTKFHSKRAAVICLTYSIFIDLDHLFDFFLYNKRISFEVISFFTTPYFTNNGRVHVLLHGWEYAIILLVLSVFLKKYRDISVALSLAIIGHLLVDQFCYGMTPFKYFLVYRWMYGFGIEL